MASHVSSSNYLLQQCWIQLFIGFSLLLLVTIPNKVTGSSSYTTLFSFGDSLADTGNLYHSTSDPKTIHCFLPPYGETFFKHPSGRCSDGRLIVDFYAESLGLPLLSPYVGIKKGAVKSTNITKGVNFAVIGATALDIGFFEKKGIQNVATNDSLTVQLGWFKEFLPSLCKSNSSCKDLLKSSLFLVGEIGGNDFNYHFFLNKKVEELKTYVPQVISKITSTINEVLPTIHRRVGNTRVDRELVDLGAMTLIVPGNLPIGCSSAYLTLYQTKNQDEYDKFGCIKWLNDFVEFYNGQLQSELGHLRKLHPHAKIEYGDYYNAALRLYHDPKKYGFEAGAHKACCGGGGPYNYNATAECGNPGSSRCDDSSHYISWDGIHLTEAAYRLISQDLIERQKAVHIS